jgi:hypothetical protein
MDLWARVDDDTRLLTIWCEVKPPNYSPIDPGGSGQAEMDLVKTIGVWNSATGRYEWNDLGSGPSAPDFSDSGTYQILYFAKDNITGNVSPLKVSRIYKAIDPNSPPDPFDLVGPPDASEGLTTFIVDWEDTTDPDGDNFTYTVLLSKGDASFSDPIRKEGLPYSTCLMTPDDGISDLSNYYWKVQAIDEYGAIRETGVWLYSTNNTNPVWPGWISGHVYDTATGRSITDALVSVAGSDLPAELHGYYLGQVPAGKYAVTATAGGYQSKSYNDVDVPAGGPVVRKDFGLDPATGPVRKGDINGDDTVDLADAIIALKALTGADASGIIRPHYETSGADVNGDASIGLDEAIYVLQAVSQARPEQQ